MADENENVVKFELRPVEWLRPDDYFRLDVLLERHEKLTAMQEEEENGMLIDDMIAFDKEAQELLGELRERATASAQVAAEPEPQPANNDGREFCFDASCGGRVKLVPGILSTFGVCTRCGR